VRVPVAFVAELPALDLSVHVVIELPLEGAVPVPAGSVPSSHMTNPEKNVGVKATVVMLNEADAVVP
jgi:hypothetical protein